MAWHSIIIIMCCYQQGVHCLGFSKIDRWIYRDPSKFFSSDLFMTNNISFLRQIGGLRVLYVVVDIVNITVDTVKLFCIILIALTI